MVKVTFVCTGATCRSPMAESIFKNLVKKYGADCKVSAKGICIDPNNLEVNEIAKKILKEHNITPVNHKASKITTKALRESDYVVCMTSSQKEQLLNDLIRCKNKEDKSLKDKVFCIKELVNGVDIPDPYGYGEAEYEAVFKVLFVSLERLYARLFKKQ